MHFVCALSLTDKRLLGGGHVLGCGEPVRIVVAGRHAAVVLNVAVHEGHGAESAQARAGGTCQHTIHARSGLSCFTHFFVGRTTHRGPVREEARFLA